MNYLDKIQEQLSKSGGIITSAYIRDNEIPSIYLTRLTREGKLRRIARGIYMAEGGIYDELFVLQTRYPKIIFSYETALQLLNLTDKIPEQINVTVNNNYKFNNKPQNIQVNYVCNELLEAGVIEGQTNIGNIVSFYSAERTLCDFIKYKSEMDPEVYLSFVKAYSNYKEKDIHELFSIAQKMDVVKEVKEVMELVYE
ncbi:MAG: type IV toxin-antitoxin system AbiEi family antitoxin domain-containing protein [Erysipelotrichaceae bacterium]|nr:type IV toxin-antitoxin system AbiEi family antitoxin domain-containing protein [Erysipelotrichaceae bacterium]